MWKACIFDLDGVLVNTATHHYRAWHRLAISLGVSFSEAQNEELKGVGRLQSLEQILRWGNLQIDDAEKQRLMQLKNEWYLEGINSLTPADMLPGALHFLTELNNKGMSTALGSASKNAQIIISKLDISHLLDAVVDGNKTFNSKPHPEVFLKAAEELGKTPAECIVFEDAVSGVQAAKAGGFFCVGIGSAQVLHMADVVIPGLDEMSVLRMSGFKRQA